MAKVPIPLDEHSKYVLEDIRERLNDATAEGNRYFSVKGPAEMLLVSMALKIAAEYGVTNQ